MKLSSNSASYNFACKHTIPIISVRELRYSILYIIGTTLRTVKMKIMSIAYLIYFGIVVCSARPLNISLEDYPTSVWNGPCGPETVIELPPIPTTSTTQTPIVRATPWSNITNEVSGIPSTPSSLAEIVKSKDNLSLHKLIDNLEYETEVITEIYYEMDAVPNAYVVDLNGPQADQNVDTYNSNLIPADGPTIDLPHDYDVFPQDYDVTEMEDWFMSVPEIHTESTQFITDDPSINLPHYYDEYINYSGEFSTRDEVKVSTTHEEKPPLYFPGMVRGVIYFHSSGGDAYLYTSSSFLLLLSFFLIRVIM